MTDNSLQIQLNGETLHVARGTTIAEMLSRLGLDSRRIAVERNLEIVPRSDLSDVPVQDGDAFEIVHFVGGG